MKYCAFIASLSRCLSISKYFDSPLKLLTISPNNGDSKGSGDRSILITLIDNIDYFFQILFSIFIWKIWNGILKQWICLQLQRFIHFYQENKLWQDGVWLNRYTPLTSSPPKPPKIKIIKQQTPKIRSQRKIISKLN